MKLKKSTLLIVIMAALVLVSVVIGLLVARPGTSLTQTSSFDAADAVPDRITRDSDALEILALMNHSQEEWQTVQLTMSANIVYEGEDFTSQTTYTIAPGARAGVLYEDDERSERWVSDGTAWLHEKLDENVYTTATVPPQIKEAIQNFIVPAATESDNIYPHPFTRLIPFPGIDLIYPTGIAQTILNNGQIVVLGEERIAGRDAVLVQRIHGSGATEMKHLYWVDAETGLILQAQFFTPTSPDQWYAQYTVTEIFYDAPVDDALFDLMPLSLDSEYLSPEAFRASGG